MAGIVTAVPADQLVPADIPMTWLWPGFLARGTVTLLVGEWGAGKSTLLSVLLSRLGSGGTLAGRTVLPASTLVLSEEAPDIWRERNERFHYPNSIRFICRPYPGQAMLSDWERIIENVAGGEHVPDVIVIDPFMMFFPTNIEGSTTRMVNAMAALHRLTDRGCAILILHHPSKNSWRRLVGRGNAALHNFVEIDVKFGRDPGGLSPRVRRIESNTRLFGSNASVRMALTDDGTDYTPLPEVAEPGSWEEGWAVIRGVLEAAGMPLTATEMRNAWHEDVERPALAKLRRWLTLAHADGLLTRTGTGRCNDPYRFGLKG